MIDQLNLTERQAGNLKKLFHRLKRKRKADLTEIEFISLIVRELFDVYRKPLKTHNRSQVSLMNDLKSFISFSNKTQKQIAAEVGVSEAHLSQIINGKNDPSVKIALLLLESLNLTPSRMTRVFWLEPTPGFNQAPLEIVKWDLL